MTKSTEKLYGGDWTKRKLEILRGYLNAYTQALKWQPSKDKPFKLMYIDAFAGTGKVELRSKSRYLADIREFLDGSAEIAVKIYNKKPFDKLVFVEQKLTRYKKLLDLKRRYESQNIEVINGDSNDYLQALCSSWQTGYGGNWRGVLFLDPFATEVDWVTIEAVAKTRAFDTWIWFPVSSIARMLPKYREPDQISAENLIRIFGDESWRELYDNPKQKRLPLGGPKSRDPGVDGIVKIYKGRLRSIVSGRFLKESHQFKNSRNSRMFELLFFAGSGNPNAINLSHKIANHLMKN
ncbi:MAG: three-Cys-motif partner protein TcmP [Gammaproteobacteria bacterium]|nr:three-Cys-motif partner protein TcmP [Gammaproteobacteria bacterium]